MDTQAVRKTYKYKLKPPPQQEEALAFVTRRCRELYTAALQERKQAWEKRRLSVTETMQSAPLPAGKEVRPEYHAIHSPVLQDALTRLDMIDGFAIGLEHHGDGDSTETVGYDE